MCGDPIHRENPMAGKHSENIKISESLINTDDSRNKRYEFSKRPKLNRKPLIFRM